jgi:threonine/homoserine/homoserine lactone efflux protein
MLLSLFWLGFALAASPGPDFFLITSHTLAHGRYIGYVTLAGNRLSLCIHISLAVLGLSLILQRSATVYLAVRLGGAAYLIFLGWKKFTADARRGGDIIGSAQNSCAIRAAVAFRQGFLNNLLNPKVSLFFLSLFPQFTSAELLERSPLAVAAVFFVGNTAWWLPLVFVVGSPTVRARLQKFQRFLDLAFGAVFIICGVRIIAGELLGI